MSNLAYEEQIAERFYEEEAPAVSVCALLVRLDIRILLNMLTGCISATGNGVIGSLLGQ